MLQTLQTLGLVKVATHKTRRTITVLDPASFARWTATNFPTEELPVELLPARAQNIARERDSKVGATTHAVQPVLFKWFDPNPDASLAQLSQIYGMVGVTSERMTHLSLPAVWYLLTVENWESFYTLSYQTSSVPVMMVYLGGNVSDVALATLADLTPSPSAILHFGDYDWAGLAIFQRLEARLPQAQLYIARNLTSLFQRYGKRELVEKQALASLDLQHPKCQPVIACIAQYNAGLEQEIVPAPSWDDFQLL
ncbi:MAG: DUF2399 domain-containing protein [Anaerolineae bacterium]|nr:DUF2399 domain-containing protein [Anaerolineae bacterium]